MKKILFFVLVAILSATVFAGPNVLQTAKIAFVNNTAAKTDTIQTNDSAWCVISTKLMGKMSDKITIFLPDVLASGDTLTVTAELIASDCYGSCGNRYVNGNSAIASNERVSDQVDAPLSTGTVNVFGGLALGTWGYGAGAFVKTISVPDSANCERLRIVLGESAGSANAVQITGCDSLTTSNAYATWTIEEQ